MQKKDLERVTESRRVTVLLLCLLQECKDVLQLIKETFRLVFLYADGTDTVM